MDKRNTAYEKKEKKDWNKTPDLLLLEEVSNLCNFILHSNLHIIPGIFSNLVRYREVHVKNKYCFDVRVY